MVMRLPISQGLFALVDDEDYATVIAAGPWYASRTTPTVTYVTRNVPAAHTIHGRTTQGLHRFLTGWKLTDHINHDGLDNRRVNLRDATQSQQTMNQRIRRDNTTGFRGVCYRKGRANPWVAAIMLNGKRQVLRPLLFSRIRSARVRRGSDRPVRRIRLPQLPIGAIRMSTIELAPTQSPGFVGQATQIEQSRAIAEVQAMVIVAQQCPRDLSRVVEKMRETCRQPALAERAFYKFPRGGQTVQGPSIHLARELARCFGNVAYGINELRRDDQAGISEMQSYAWDLEANTRSAQIFIVPHMRDKRGGPEKLTDLRDVYENNANNGARRLREAIYSVLPSWFVAEAEDRCRATLKDGGGKSLAQRITDAVSLFEGVGISVDRLEAKVGRKTSKWNEHDIVQLGVTFRSIERGEISAEDEFGSNRVTAAEILHQPNGDPIPSQPADDPPAAVSPAQVKSLQILASQKGFRSRVERLAWAAQVVEFDLQSFNDLTAAEAATVRAALDELPDVDK